MANALRLAKNYDVLWLTLAAWAIFVVSFSYHVPHYVPAPSAYVFIFAPPIISFVAAVWAFARRSRLHSIMAFVAAMSCVAQLMLGVFE